MKLGPGRAAGTSRVVAFLGVAAFPTRLTKSTSVPTDPHGIYPSLIQISMAFRPLMAQVMEVLLFLVAIMLTGFSGLRYPPQLLHLQSPLSFGPEQMSMPKHLQSLP